MSKKKKVIWGAITGKGNEAGTKRESREKTSGKGRVIVTAPKRV